MSVMIGIRIGKDEKKRLAEAAKSSGMTLSGFLRQSARIEAQRVLSARQFGVVDHEGGTRPIVIGKPRRSRHQQTPKQGEKQ